MSRLRLFLISLGLLSTCAALAACGSSEQTGTIGTSEVTISGEAESLVEKMRAIAEQQPYEKWALNCVIGQFEKVLTPAREEELEGASEAELGEFLVPDLETINHACEQPGRHIFKPDATEDELAVVRSSEVAGIRLLLKAEGVPTPIRECVEGKIASLPGPELVVLIEAPESKREELFEVLAAPCFGG